MDSKIQSKLLTWIRTGQLPEKNEIGKLRRRVASSGHEELARVLVSTEKALENDHSDPLKKLRLFFRQGGTSAREISLVQDKFEPFPRLRQRVLENLVDRCEGKIVKNGVKNVTVRVFDEAAGNLIKSAYNWKVNEE